MWQGVSVCLSVCTPDLIWWCHQLVAHPSETVRLPWQVHERGTVYRQLSAQPPHRLLPLKKNLNHFCLDCHSVCDNVYRSFTMFSALAAVCTIDCAIEIVLITLHYITSECLETWHSSSPRQYVTAYWYSVQKGMGLGRVCRLGLWFRI